MAARAERGDVACTYDECRFYFKSEREMKEHKSERHDYCARCDKDFENEEYLLIHKIKSQKHIVCPICGCEFRSEGGRDLHLRQSHPAEQHIKCPAKNCGKIFPRASAFVSHIERGECQGGITEERLIQQRAMKTMVSNALHHQRGFPSPPISGRYDNSGVPMSLKELQSREAMVNQPTHGDDDAKSTVSTSLSLKHWPKLGEKSKPESEYGPNDLVPFNHLTGPTTTKTKEKENYPSQVAARNLAQPSEIRAPVPSGRFFGQEAVNFYRAYHPGWDPNQFLNPHTGKYQCCGGEFDDVKRLAEHLILHFGRNFKCPGCKRQFKSNAALVAHCETSKRCPAILHDPHGSIVGEVSGGVVHAAGYHEDGTIKFEAGEFDTSEKTVVGPDLTKQW